MKGPNFAFRNFLYKLVKHKQGIITQSDYPKINEDHSNPRSQIISLTHILEDIDSAGLSDLANRLYTSFILSTQESRLKSLASVKSVLNTRYKHHYFYKWTQPTTPRQIKPAEHSPEPRPLPIKHSPKISQFSYETSDKKKPPNRHRNSSYSSFFEKEETENLYERLYREAEEKQKNLEKLRLGEKDKDLEDCTFRPEITDSSARSLVYERLTFEDKKEKQEFLTQQKIRRELEGCTFRPQTNSVPSQRETSCEKLYSDAEAQRQKLRFKELENRQKELDNCTFHPSVLNPSKSVSSKVYEKLYKDFQETQKEKRRKELEKKMQESDRSNYVPRLITPRKNQDSTPVYERLYGDVEKRREKMVKIEEKQKNSPKKHKKIEDPPRFEVLYALSKTSRDRKAELEEKILRDSGVSFKPDISKRQSPSKYKK